MKRKWQNFEEVGISQQQQVDELPLKNQALCVFCVTCIVLVCVVLFCFTLLYSLCYYK